MKEIILQDGKQLEIFMHPKRQQILHQLRVKGPMTAKMLSETLTMTPSSAKHHVQRLMELGVVEIDHTEVIHGITATYYRNALVTVSFRSLAEENKVIAANYVTKQVYDGFYQVPRKGFDDDGHFQADQLSGVVHLNKAEADELYQIIRTFLDEREEKKEGTEPFVYALVAYHA